jgi:hypothetical protein
MLVGIRTKIIPISVPAHFQYTDEVETDYQSFLFEHETPSLRLLEVIDHLVSEVLYIQG